MPAIAPAGARRVLVQALAEAGSIVQGAIGRVGYAYKGRANLVTEADRASQAAILRRVSRAFPAHGWWAEEDARREAPEYVWVIDPLDGTTNFAHGFPVCCVSIGLVRLGRGPVLGGVLDPFRRELFLAERGKGATLNGRAIRVSPAGALSESLLLTGFPYDRGRRALFYTGLYAVFMEKCHDVRRSGAAALDMAWTACGRADGFWEFRLSPWDVAAGKLLVEEAGGKVTDFEGRPWRDLEGYGRETLATNGRLHRPMLRVLRGAMRREAAGRSPRRPP